MAAAPSKTWAILRPTARDDHGLDVRHVLVQALGQQGAIGAVFVLGVSMAGRAGHEDDLLLGRGRGAFASSADPGPPFAARHSPISNVPTTPSFVVFILGSPFRSGKGGKGLSDFRPTKMGLSPLLVGSIISRPARPRKPPRLDHQQQQQGGRTSGHPAQQKGRPVAVQVEMPEPDERRVPVVILQDSAEDHAGGDAQSGDGEPDRDIGGVRLACGANFSIKLGWPMFSPTQAIHITHAPTIHQGCCGWPRRRTAGPGRSGARCRSSPGDCPIGR